MENLGAQSKEQTNSVAQTADNEKLSMGFQFGKQKTKRRKWARFGINEKRMLGRRVKGSKKSCRFSLSPWIYDKQFL